MSFFKNLFSPKEKPKDEPKIDFKVAEMKDGFLLDYDFTSWIVEDSSTYNWADGSKELEFTITTGKKKRFLNSNIQSTNLSVYWDAKFDEVWPSGRTKVQNETIDMSDGFHFDNRNFIFFGNGSAEVQASAETYFVKNWLFECDKQEYLVSFNKYEDNSIEVYVGKRLKDHEISNILKRE
jgi:hypothetical protein